MKPLPLAHRNNTYDQCVCNGIQHRQLPSMSFDRRWAHRLKAGLYQFQFREILFVSFWVKCHETIRMRQGM
jgi:hypothetical protein